MSGRVGTRRILAATLLVAGCLDNPAAPPAPYPAVPLTAIAAGSDVTCGSSADTTFYCWGAPQLLGHLVDSACAADPMCTGVPAPLDAQFRFVSFTVPRGSGGQTCGIVAGGQSYCWGEVGGFDYTFWHYTTPVAFPPGGPFRMMSSGGRHTCALDQQAQAWCWGANYQMELGTGFAVDSIEATDVPQQVAGGATFTQLTAGNLHTCGLNGTGQALCWGANNAGQLGTGPASPDPGSCIFLDICTGTPAPVLGGFSFTAVSAGGAHTCGIVTGVLYCWGADDAGQLGTTAVHDTCTGYPVAAGSYPCSREPVPVAFPFASASQSIVAVTTGWSHTCALTADGKAYCWGSNEHGQLGSGRHGGSVAQPAAVAGGPAAFRAITAGRDFTCGLATNGEAWCWGGNEAGQLGDGTLQDRDAPVPVRRPRP